MAATSIKPSKTTEPEKKAKYSQLTDEQLKWPHWIYQWISITTLYLYYRFYLGNTIRVWGRENVPKEWFPCIMACNHSTSLDPPLVSIALLYRPISYMAKIELFDTPIMRLYNWCMATFAVNREKVELSSIKTALKVLKHGKWALGIFPEGTRKKDGGVMESPKKGVAYFAKAAKVPVIPFGIAHTVKNGKKVIEVEIGTMIPPEDDLDALTEKIQSAIKALVEKGAQRPL
jgi:1-acyl-sn-glycerol-3-phosphate acyltransferase